MRSLLKIFILFYTGLSAQEFTYHIPEIVKTEIDKGLDCLKNKEESCLDYFEKALQEAKRIDKDSLLALTYYDIGDVVYSHGNVQDLVNYASRGILLDGNEHPYTTHRLHRDLGYAYSKLGLVDSLFPIYQRAYKWAEVAGDTSGMAMAQIRLSSAYRMKSDFATAIKILLEARPLVRATGDIHRESGILFSLGNIYLGTNDLSQAMEKFDEAALGFINAEDSSMYARSILNWGIAANANDEQNAVLERLPKIIDIVKNNSPNETMYLKTQLARAHTKNKEYDKAIPLYEYNIMDATNLGNEMMRKLNKKQLGALYVEIGDGKKATQLLEEVYAIESKRGVTDAYLNTAKTYADALVLDGNTSLASDIYKNYIRVNDSLFNKTKEKEIATMREQFDADRREAKIELLVEKETTSKLQKGILVAGLLAVLGVLGALWVRFRESKKRATLERQKHDAEIEYKQKELTTHALHLAKKNEILVDLKKKVQQMEGGCETRDIINTINFDLKDEDSWEHFTQYFEKVHTDFSKNAQQRYPKVTSNELRFMALVRMNLSSKEIANILNITPDGVKKARQRLRKKMELTPQDSLETEIINL